MPQETLRPHHLVLEDRRRLTVSGVLDVASFDENAIVLKTTKGGLQIKGSDLHVDKLSLDGGDLSVEGIVDSFSYQEPEQQPGGGFFARIFR